MIKIFVASDVHGKFLELWEHFISDGFMPGDKTNLVILNGDIIDANDTCQDQTNQLNIIRDYINKYKNIIYIKGNHEVLLKLDDKDLQSFINKLPVAYINDNLFICHGWFNPKWTIAEHKNKIMQDDYQSANFGDIYHGSPQNIIVREQLNKDFFGYYTFDQYEQTLIELYPSQKFIFGHFFNFLWSYEKCKHLHYFLFQEELQKFKLGSDNLITTMVKEFDYSKPYISKHEKIYCIDVFTKCFKLDLPYYFCILKFNSNTLGKLFDEDGNEKQFKFE